MPEFIKSTWDVDEPARQAKYQPIPGVSKPSFLKSKTVVEEVVDVPKQKTLKERLAKLRKMDVIKKVLELKSKLAKN